ncbi:MAG: phage/plasmid primase, P4 family [Bacteroidales bacterium]|jgi:putative DNA primase/helicase|nr:phage/plasmid primase, P4 family [Bacteroidales bacterium]
MIWDNIPEELKVNGLWCCWRLNKSKGKIPYDAETGKFAKSNDKSTFHNFQTVLKSLPKYYSFDEEGKLVGGLGLGIFNGYSAIDIDHCIDENGKLNDLAKDVVDYCQSYTEISPSGTGIRIIFKTKTELNKNVYFVNNHNIGLEIYISEQTNKYVTITGDVMYPSSIIEIDIGYILEKYMLKHENNYGVITNKKFKIDDYKNDIKLIELWNETAPGANENESEMDLALCNKLAYYLKSDFNSINNAFMSSPYYKSKDSKHKTKWEVRNDYREMTIKTSIQGLSVSASHVDEFNLTDTGNAHKFVDMFGEMIRFNIDNKKWMFWNNKYWQTDVFNNIKNYAEIVIEDMKISAKTTDMEDIRKAMLKNVKRALQTNGKTALIKEAEHLENIPVLNQIFDHDKFLFNCESGVVDLRTGKISPSDKSQMLSRFSPFEIDKREPKLWLKFLEDIFENDQEVIDYLQRIFGYSMSGSTREQCMFMLIGDGSNGKSLLLDVINESLGSYGSTSNVEILLEQHNGSGSNLGDIARLNGIRHVVTDEAKLGDKLNESAIKTMTSGIGKIVARFLYGNEFEFTPLFKIFMASNYKPTIRGTDHGIWRRIKVIPFNKVIPDEKQDKDLKIKLMNEMPQILNWMIEGCLKWQKHGLKEPKSLKQAAKEYRSEMDVVQRWVEEVCMIGGNYKEKSSDLFQNFSNYVKANKEFQLSHTMFGRNLSKKFQKRIFAGTTHYQGLKLKENNEYRIDKELYDEI